jgi:hypothetical protein
MNHRNGCTLCVLDIDRISNFAIVREVLYRSVMAATNRILILVSLDV